MLSERIAHFRSTWKPYCKRYSPLLYRDADYIITALEAELELEKSSNRVLDGVIKELHKTLHEEQQKNKILQDEIDKFPGEGLVSDPIVD